MHISRRTNATFTVSFCLFLLTSLINISCSLTFASSEKAIKDIGTFYSPEKTYKVQVTVNSMGGFRDLVVYKDDSKVSEFRDVNAFIWIENHKILYSVSPVYGKPGIYLFDCKTKKNDIITKPSVLNSAYQNGADYFELNDYTNSSKEFTYFYAPDIDLVEFETFRNKSNIRKQKL